MFYNNFEVIIIERLRELRESRHISQVRLAMDLNVTQAVISKYELGKSEPDKQMLCALSDYFGVSADYLLGRQDNKEYRMTTDEEKLLNLYRSLDTPRREKLIGYAEGLKDMFNKK